MKAAVRYQSRSGNTRRLAEAIAEAVGVQALGAAEGPPHEVDTLFVGGGIYAGKLDKSLLKLIGKLEAGKVANLAVFTTSMRSIGAVKLIQAALPEGIDIIGELDCPGSFLFFNKKRPNDEDLESARGFARKMLALAAQKRPRAFSNSL